MSEKHLLNPLPPKFITLAKSAIELEIEREIALRNDDTTPDEVLFDTAYGNDIPILQKVADEMNNPNQTVVGDLYVVSESDDRAGFVSSSLQLFGQALPDDETIKWVFLAKDFDEACAIKNRLMDFLPYKPMPSNIAMNEQYALKNSQEQYVLKACIYQPQNFDGIWHCDYSIACDLPEFQSIYQTVCHQNGLTVLKNAIKSVESELSKFRKLGFEVL